MRAFGIIGMWIRSLAVGPTGFVLVYLAVCIAILYAARKRRHVDPRKILPWLLGFAGAFLILCLPYPAMALRVPLLWWSGRLEAAHAPELTRDSAYQRGTVVVVFGGGALSQGIASSTTLKRMHEAMAVWRSIPEATFMLSEGGIARYRAEAWFRKYLQREGVPNEQIILETKALTTQQNARFCAELITAHALEHVILVTSRNHLPRAYLTARRHGLRPTLVGVPTSAPDAAFCPTWHSLVSLSHMLNEYIGIAGYMLLDWI